MRVETLRTAFTYLTGLIIVIGSGVLLLLAPPDRFESMLPFVTAIVGAVVAYIFAREQTQVVQTGNGLERARLDELASQIHSLTLATQPPPGSGAPVIAERVDVAGEEVNVTEGPQR